MVGAGRFSRPVATSRRPGRAQPGCVCPPAAAAPVSFPLARVCWHSITVYLHLSSSAFSSNKQAVPDVGPSSPSDESNGDRAQSPFMNGGNSSIKGMNAPPSPPIPTPPLHASNDNSEDLSDLHITSPNAAATNGSHAGGEAASPDVHMANNEVERNGIKRSSEGHEKQSDGSSASGASDANEGDASFASNNDQTMTEASKSAREPEDDDPDGRPLKRAKTEDATDTASASTSTELTGPLTAARAKFVMGVIRSLRRMRASRQFNMPVDTVKFNIPHYYNVVTQPMDLQTMERKLQAGEYNTVDEFVRDLTLIVENSLKFNGPDHQVTKDGRSMEGSFYRLMQELPSEDVVEVEKSKPAKKKAVKAAPKVKPATKTPKPSQPKRSAPAQSPSAPVFSLNPQGVPQVRRNSEKSDGRPKREIHPPASKDLPYMKPRRKHNAAELKFCNTVLKDLLSKKHEHVNFPFKEPVDPVALNIPDYFKIIKHPMDLGTISQKLKDNDYENAIEFEADVRLMFQNCYKFNPASQPVHQMGRKLEEAFETMWRNKPVPHTRRSQSFDDEDESEEEEEEDEIPDHEVVQLERQLELMKDQIAQIKKSSKKKTPVAQSKKKTGGSNRKMSVPSKKNTKKVPYVSLEQKTELSERINLLPADKMNNAMEMLKKNMPQLLDVSRLVIE